MGKRGASQGVSRALERLPPEKKPDFAQPGDSLPTSVPALAVAISHPEESKSVLRRAWHGFLARDQRAHRWLVEKFPKSSTSLSTFLEGMEAVLRDSLFGIFLCLVLAVLAIATAQYIVLTALMAAWAIAFVGIARIERVRRLTILTRGVFLLATGTLLWLGLQRFGTWAIQQHIAETTLPPPAQTEKPKTLRGRIVQLGVGSLYMGNNSPLVPVVTIFMSVYNSGPPSVVINYSLYFPQPNGEALFGQPMKVPKTINYSDLNMHISDADKGSLIDKTLESPVASGGSADGIIMFAFPVGSRPEIDGVLNDAVVRFEDAAGNQYEARTEGRAVVGQLPQTYPGMPNPSRGISPKKR